MVEFFDRDRVKREDIVCFKNGCHKYYYVIDVVVTLKDFYIYEIIVLDSSHIYEENTHALTSHAAIQSKKTV